MLKLNSLWWLEWEFTKHNEVEKLTLSFYLSIKIIPYIKMAFTHKFKLEFSYKLLIQNLNDSEWVHLWFVRQMLCNVDFSSLPLSQESMLSALLAGSFLQLKTTVPLSVQLCLLHHYQKLCGRVTLSLMPPRRTCVTSFLKFVCILRKVEWLQSGRILLKWGPEGDFPWS